MILRYFKDDQKVMVFDNESERGSFKIEGVNQKVALKSKQTFEYDLSEHENGVVLFIGEAKLTLTGAAAQADRGGSSNSDQQLLDAPTQVLPNFKRPAAMAGEKKKKKVGFASSDSEEDFGAPIQALVNKDSQVSFGLSADQKKKAETDLLGPTQVLPQGRMAAIEEEDDDDIHSSPDFGGPTQILPAGKAKKAQQNEFNFDMDAPT